MTTIQTTCCSINLPPYSKYHCFKLITPESANDLRNQPFTVLAAKSGGFSLNPILKKCQRCGGEGAIECPGCKGTGKNKKNGNIFERWKCFDCQGFGLKSCPVCGKGGLTPEQRGER